MHAESLPYMETRVPRFATKESSFGVKIVKASSMEATQKPFTRKKPDQLVYLELGSGNGGMLLSVSEDGFRFRAVSPLRPNGLMPFAFSLDGSQRLQGIGEVEWLEDDGKSGDDHCACSHSLPSGVLVRVPPDGTVQKAEGRQSATNPSTRPGDGILPERGG